MNAYMYMHGGDKEVYCTESRTAVDIVAIPGNVCVEYCESKVLTRENKHAKTSS